MRNTQIPRYPARCRFGSLDATKGGNSYCLAGDLNMSRSEEQQDMGLHFLVEGGLYRKTDRKTTILGAPLKKAKTPPKQPCWTVAA